MFPLVQEGRRKGKKKKGKAALQQRSAALHFNDSPQLSVSAQEAAGCTLGEVGASSRTA